MRDAKTYTPNFLGYRWFNCKEAYQLFLPFWHNESLIKLSKGIGDKYSTYRQG